MGDKDTGGAAFPHASYGLHDASPGMTLRDYFAIHAAHDDVKAQGELIRLERIRTTGMGILPDGWHITARYMHADAMLKARQE